MGGVGGPLAGAGGPTRRERDLPLARRAGSFLIWWVVLMTFWVWLDDSTGLAELVGGAIFATLGAVLAELVQYQSSTHIRIRVELIPPALALPLQVVRDTAVVFSCLWRRVARGERPPSGFEVVPTRYGGESPEDATRRALLLGGKSLAPNTFALGIDPEREVVVVHRLVMDDRTVPRNPT